MLFDIAHVPFSRRGRFLTLSTMTGRNGNPALWLRSVHGGDDRSPLGRLARIEFFDADGNPGKPRITLSPHRLDVEVGENGRASFAIGAGECLHIEGTGCGVRFAFDGGRYDYAGKTPDGRDVMVLASANRKVAPECFAGKMRVSGTWQRDHSEAMALTFSGERFAGVLTLFSRTMPRVPQERFEEANGLAEAEFGSWLVRCGRAVEGQEEAHRLAAYILWANVVPVEGLLTRPAIYMSKNAMINVWSWDNAFSAIGVASMDPVLAFDQFAVLFDHQDQSGLLPDYVNDCEALFAFTKPPVHGWAVSLIARRHPDFLTPERRAYLAGTIEKQIGYWLEHTRTGDGLPSYAHGNDSGWDNASFFEHGGPVISCDLTTFLILATDAMVLLRPEDASDWRSLGDRLLETLLSTLWDGTRFVARKPDATDALPGDSLIQFMPMLLGARLPKAVRAAMLSHLEGSGFLTAWGLATENPSSLFYRADGYWRGPIWAPTTALMIEGLQALGRSDLALTVARRFCALAAQAGMAENFNALAGAGLRDRAFAWTSAVYLYCADLLATQELEGDR